MKNFKQLPTKGFLCNFSWTWRQMFYIDLTKKTPGHIKYWPSINPFSQKIEMVPKIKYQRIYGKNWTDFIIVKLQNFDFLRKTDRFWTNVLYVKEFFWARSLHNTCLYLHKKSFCRKWLKKFHFLTLWIWLFGIFDKCPQGWDEVKNSMGLLQGPRLMAWTTKSPILENHWVPWGCMAHLGSVKTNRDHEKHWFNEWIHVHTYSAHFNFQKSLDIL